MMLRIPLPELTSAGLKSLAKVLRSPPSDEAQANACEALWALVRGRSRVHLIAGDRLAQALSPVTWITGASGTGKTELAAHTAVIASHQPNTRILFITEDQQVLETLLACGFVTGEADKVAVGSDNVAIKIPRMEVGPFEHSEAFLNALDRIPQHQRFNLFVVLDGVTVHGDEAASRASKYLHYTRARKDRQILLIQQFCDRGFCMDEANTKQDDLITCGSWRQEPVCSFYSGSTSYDFHRPQLIVDTAKARAALSDYIAQLTGQYDHLFRRLLVWFEDGKDVGKHHEALEAAARILGFSSWHSAEGFLKKSHSRAASMGYDSPPDVTLRSICQSDL